MGVKKNFIFSSILTVSTYIFPLITFPYTSRVLGVEGIGVCNFVDSIIQYFTMFSMMGIGTIGVREIAKHKNNIIERSKVFSSLISINLLATILASVVLILCSILVPKLYEYKNMLWIGLARIICNTMLVEWLYKGLEDFRYITLRSLIVRTLYVISVFIFVKDSQDYIVYFALTSGMVVINAIINIVHSRTVVEFKLMYVSICKTYVKPFLVLGCYQLLTSMYISFNVTFLGFVSSDLEVGLYTTATKLFTIILSLFTAFTGVMLPRMSSLVSSGSIPEIKYYISKSIDALSVFAFPIIVICEVYAPTIINVIAGSGYEGSILPMRIITPLLLVIGIEQILVIQILTPFKQDKAILVNSIIGAMLSIMLNMLLVRTYRNSTSSSLAWVACEVAVMCSASFFVRKHININFPWMKFIWRLLFSIMLIFVLVGIKNIVNNEIISLLIGSILTGLVYVNFERLLLKNSVVINLFSQIKGRWVRRFQ